MKEKEIIAHMIATLAYSHLSYCKKRQVGSIIVKDDRVISIGYNGAPKGWPNVCEDDDGKTLPYTLHAESNALSKLTSSTESGKGASLFSVYAPCGSCALSIIQSELKEVFYLYPYKNAEGLEYLERSKIATHKIDRDSMLGMMKDIISQHFNGKF